MYILKLRNETTDQIDKLFREFWCGEQDERRNMHTIKGNTKNNN